MATEPSRQWVEIHYPELITLHPSSIASLPDLRDFKSSCLQFLADVSTTQAQHKQAKWSETLAWELYSSELQTLEQSPYEEDRTIFEQLYDYLSSEPVVYYGIGVPGDKKLEELMNQREKLRLWVIAYPVVSLVALQVRLIDLRLAVAISHPHIDLLLTKQERDPEFVP